MSVVGTLPTALKFVLTMLGDFLVHVMMATH